MDLAHDVRPGEGQEIAVAADVARMVGEAGPAEVLLAQPVPLEHGAHGAVEHEDPIAEQPGQERQAALARERRSERVTRHRMPECTPGFGLG